MKAPVPKFPVRYQRVTLEFASPSRIRWGLLQALLSGTMRLPWHKIKHPKKKSSNSLEVTKPKVHPLYNKGQTPLTGQCNVPN